MSTGTRPSVAELLPTDAWAILQTEKDARLIDVRTQAEWAYVGCPDLSELGHTLICIEWASFPNMSINPHFAGTVQEQLGQGKPGTIMFLCRSGVRSLYAAEAVTASYAKMGVAVNCFSVAEGFEGDKDAAGQRGKRNGWKFRGLAWGQS